MSKALRVIVACSQRPSSNWCALKLSGVGPAAQLIHICPRLFSPSNANMCTDPAWNRSPVLRTKLPLGPKFQNQISASGQTEAEISPFPTLDDSISSRSSPAGWAEAPGSDRHIPCGRRSHRMTGGTGHQTQAVLQGDHKSPKHPQRLALSAKVTALPFWILFSRAKPAFAQIFVRHIKAHRALRLLGDEVLAKAAH